MAATTQQADLFEFALRMGDNALVLGQQVSAWCGHAPVLEEDIALANVALDLVGQAKLWLALAGEFEGAGQDADRLAFHRDVRAFRNCLLVEQPNGDFGQTLMRQFLFDAWHVPLLEKLKASANPQIAEVAAKSEKEALYHLDRSADLVVRLGDGSEESHARMQNALNLLWPFVGELTMADAVDERLAEAGVAPSLSEIGDHYRHYTAQIFRDAMLTVDPEPPVRKGGKAGIHGEGLGYLLAEMQTLQRSHPGAKW